MRSGNDADRTDESRRILGRVSREASSGLLSSGGPARHNAGQDAPNRPDDDPIETWGTRIGRTLGFLLTVGLILWFASYILRGF